jgi:hypothetical protein
MARPLRKLHAVNRRPRRRHRTWMRATSLATLGWGVWGLAFLWMRISRDTSPPFVAVFLTSALFAVPGLVLGAWCFRSSRAWLLFAMVPILGNGMVLTLPWVARWLRDHGAFEGF